MVNLSLVAMCRQAMGKPWARPLLSPMRRRRFLSPSGLASYLGLFESFEAARASLPASKEFDCEDVAAEFLQKRTRRIQECDYPVMWWLGRAFASGCTRVLDIGGSVGLHYYAYSNYIAMPAELSWCVVEVSAIVKLGQEEATRRGASALRFVKSVAEAGGAVDILISSGALQYIEDGYPAALLKTHGLRPVHLLLNKLPLYPGKDYVTTQNIGAQSFAPLHVYNDRDFVAQLEQLGYDLKDRWTVHERSLHLPGHPDRSFYQFSGLYFRRRNHS